MTPPANSGMAYSTPSYRLLLTDVVDDLTAVCAPLARHLKDLTPALASAFGGGWCGT